MFIILSVLLQTLACAMESNFTKEVSPNTLIETKEATHVLLKSFESGSTQVPVFEKSNNFSVLVASYSEILPDQDPRRFCPYCLPDFTDGTRIFQNMAHWTNRVCGKSVCNRTFHRNDCGNKRCEACRCDSQCSRYNDCCPDLLAELPVRQNPVKVSCVSAAMKIWNKTKLPRVKMVSGCSSEYPNKDIPVIERCRHPRPDSLEDNRPVYSGETRLHYKNTYCARCNGATELINWGVKTSCYEYTDLSAISSNYDLLQLLLDSPSCNIEFLVPADTEIRTCRFTQTAIETCNVTGEWEIYNADIKKACHLLSQPVETSLKLYANIFCAVCNGVKLDGRNDCSQGRTDRGPNVLPFSVVLNIQDDTSQEVPGNESLCPDKEVFDTNMKYCRSFMCPPQQYPKGDECISVYKSAKMMGYILGFKLIPTNVSYILAIRKADFVTHIIQFIHDSVYSLTPALSKISYNLKFSYARHDPGVAIHELDVMYSIVVGLDKPREEAERILLELTNRKWWWYDPRFSFPVYFDFVWQNISIKLWRDATPFYLSDETVIFDKLRSENYSIQEWSRKFEIPSTFWKNASAYIQVSDLLMCKRILLNTTEFFVNDSRTITVKHSGEMLKEGQFLWKDGKLQICSNFTGERAVSESLNNSTYDQTEIIMTLVCTSLSLCGLAITLIIYLILPSRKTLPARNNICLFINLFMAQLLFLTGSAAKVSTPVCRTLAIIIHYFWMSTFCWKVVCAFHMFRLFTKPLKALGYSKTLMKYILFSQTTPCLIIAAVVFVNFGLSGGESIGYSDNPYVCFLSNKLNIGLSFVLPVCFAVLLNIYLFSRSVIALRGQPDTRRHNSKNDYQRAVLYFKMALLLGFSWVLGFAALIVNEQILWYVFTVVNASIGVFVLMVFGLRNLSCVYGKESSTSGELGNTSNSKTYETSLNGKNQAVPFSSNTKL